MMTPIELAMTLGGIIGEAVLEKLAERGTEAVIEWCRDHASTPLTPEDEAHLRQALAEDGSFLTILKSQMHLGADPYLQWSF